MLNQALGNIETVGMLAAVEAADVALKTADVQLVGYQLSKGGGMVTVKILGGVSAVQAAIQAAKASAEKVGGVYATSVIPRPHPSLETLVDNKLTVGSPTAQAAKQPRPQPASAAAPKPAPKAKKTPAKKQAKTGGTAEGGE